jgi:hypothetical protein
MTSARAALTRNTGNAFKKSENKVKKLINLNVMTVFALDFILDYCLARSVG